MSYVIAGRKIANEYLALGVLGSTGLLTYGATKLGGGKKEEEPQSLADKAKAALGVGQSEEETFIKKFIADAEKEVAGSKH
ncbi:hypothetical protein FRC06_008595 [Ceratobasidium sp. 370]|nr:hypothetical protein FRC06_008595 [Ceratobasidium sp. 370]